MPDIGTQTDKIKRISTKIKIIKKEVRKRAPKQKERYIKPELLIIFDDDI